MTIPANTQDYRELSRRRLPRFLSDYVDGGANAEITLHANVADFARLRLRQRVLRDVHGVDTATTLAGEPAAMPLALAPVGMAGLMARRGEVIGLRAAERAGVAFTLSTVGICPLAELQAAARRPFWFQLYMLRDRDVVRTLLARAWAAGCRTLLFTVDLPVAGLRQRDFRNGTLGDPGLRGRLRMGLDVLARPRWACEIGLRGRPHSFGNLADVVPDPTSLDAYKAWIDANFDPTVTWRDIAWLREQWRGRLLLKGILDADDARAARDCGADGIVVSNHGGRQLDCVRSAIAALPAIAAAVGDRIEVLMDGGVRSGIDVVKALALGARGVLIGRPWVWAASARGEPGLDHLLAVFREEMRIAMALMGVVRVEQIDRSVIDGEF